MTQNSEKKAASEEETKAEPISELETEEPDTDSVDDSESLSFADLPEESGSTETIRELEQQLAASQERLFELEDKSTRLLAEMENLRRRNNKEVEEARKFGISKLATEITQAVDHLTIALSLVPPSMLPKNQGKDKSQLAQLITGLVMTEKALLNTLESHGITRTLVQVGDVFDPNSHQALAKIDSDTIEANCVVQCHGNTYRLGERLLRPAMVVISTGKKDENIAAEKPEPVNENF